MTVRKELQLAGDLDQRVTLHRFLPQYLDTGTDTKA